MALTSLVPAAERQPVWRRQGYHFAEGGVGTVDEALAAAQLDWEVAKVPLYTHNSGGFVQTPDRWAIQRTDTEQNLGYVGSDYEEFQNRDAFQFVWDVVDVGKAEIDTLGGFRDGRVVWAALTLPKDIIIKGLKGRDKIARNIVIVTSHDGTKAIQAFTSNICIVCQNTLTMAIKGAQNRWTVKHTKTAEMRLQEARNTLGLAWKSDEKFIEVMNHLADQSFNEKRFHTLVDQLVPKQPQVNERIKELYATTENVADGLKGTKYGALQVIGEAYDWATARNDRSPEAQLISAWQGQGYKARSKALSILTGTR